MGLGSADIYVSYARKDEPSRNLIDKLRQAAESSGRKLFRQSSDGTLEEVTANIRLDEECLHYGESILGFMDEVATARHLILIISDAYLRSPYCMYECVSAFNAIENCYWPAVVFIANELDEEGAILYFDDKGLPSIFFTNMEDYWRRQLKKLEKGDPACIWYQKSIRMAKELEAWLIGRRWAGSPDRLLPVWKEGSMTAKEERNALKDYLGRALNPVKNAYPCPSTDKLRDHSIAEIIQLLNDNPELEKVLCSGMILGNDGLRRQEVERWLDDPANFIIEELTTIFNPKLGAEKLNHLRKSADKLFGELVKYGVQIETVHHQLQQMNQISHAHAPMSVSSECVLPEMADAFFRNRPAVYREIVENDEIGYIGRREYPISDNNILESREAAQDAAEAYTQSFLIQAADLFYVRDDGRPTKKPGPKLLRQSMEKKIKNSNDFIIRITGMDEADARTLTQKLKSNSVLKDVPIYVSTGKQDDAIETSADWYDAVFQYYEARDRNGN